MKEPAAQAAAHRRSQRHLEGPQSRGFELAHAFRIFTEYFAGLRALHFAGPCVTVFGSSRLGEGDPAYALARRTGALIARAGLTVMTGGGPGLMEAANRGAFESGGRSIGCAIDLPSEQRTNPYTDTHIRFEHFFIRKVMLVKYAVGFIALPGGYGTFDELFETATLITTEKIRDFPIVLLGSDFWRPVVDVLRSDLLRRHTLTPHDLAHLHVEDDPEAAVRHILAAGRLLQQRREPRRRWWLGE